MAFYTQRGQLQTEICQVHDETDNDWRHEMRQTIKDNRMEFCFNIVYTWPNHPSFVLYRQVTYYD